MKVAYIDLETNYVGKHTDQALFSDCRNHLITVLGVRVIDAKTDEFIQLVDKDVTKKALMDTLRGVRQLVSYNGRSIPDSLKGRVGFDFPVISAQLGVVLDKEFEHKDLVPECWRRNLYGGQKKVEEILGLKRKLTDKDGGWATEAWGKYLETKKKSYLDDLLAYNREDVFMLREIELKLEKL